MGVFGYIKEKKREFAEEKRKKTTQRLADVTAELKVAKAEGQIFRENVKLTTQLKQSKKALFEAKHPMVSAGLQKLGKKLKEAKKQKKGVFAKTSAQSNPFMPSGGSPFASVPTKKKGKGKGPGEGVFY